MTNKQAKDKEYKELTLKAINDMIVKYKTMNLSKVETIGNNIYCPMCKLSNDIVYNIKGYNCNTCIINLYNDYTGCCSYKSMPLIHNATTNKEAKLICKPRMKFYKNLLKVCTKLPNKCFNPDTKYDWSKHLSYNM